MMFGESVRDLLAEAKAAAGGSAWNDLRAIRFTATIRAGGLSGLNDQLIDLRTGRMRASSTLGPARIERGFDGTSAWQRSPTGEVAVQDSEAGARSAASEAWVNARAWWFPSRWPAAIEALGMRSVDGSTYDVIGALPQGGQPLELWFDRDTHLLDRIVQNVIGRESTKRFGDYRSVGGVRLPFRIATGSGDPRHDIVIEVGDVQLDPPLSDTDFAVPVQAFDDVGFVAGGSRATIPIDIVGNHVYLTVGVIGTALRCMLDTGGVNLLTPEAAARAGVRSEGAIEARGPGAQSVSAGLARIDRMVIGDAVTLDRQLFRVMAMPGFDEVEGTAFDGVIGYEVFKRLAVQIDYAGRTATFMEPSTCIAPAGAQTLPITFFAHFPAVSGELDGLPGQFWLDTGNRNGLTLWASFVDANQLVQRYQASAETTIGWGVGGRAVGRVARGGRLALGGVDVVAPVLTLAVGEQGALSIRHVAGNIGGEILRRLVVTFDYARNVVHLAPAATLHEPFLHDRCGMWINGCDGGLSVRSVMPAGPAAEAGLRVDDVIATVDGVPAQTIGLDALRGRLRESPAGTEVRFGVTRDGVASEAAVRLRDLIAVAP